MKVLVTGGTGFIGSHLVEALLNKNYEVYCLVRNPKKIRYLNGINVNLIQADLSERETLEKIKWDFDLIFNLSGITKASHPEEFFRSNYLGTKNLVEVVLEKNHSLRRFVHISSLAAVGPCRNSKPVDELTEPDPVSEYGKSKLMGERVVNYYREKIPITIVRPPAVYGPRDTDFLTFFKMVNSGFVFYFTEGLYSVIYVDDLVRGIIEAGESDKTSGEILFLADSEPYSSSDITNAISEALKRNPKKVKIPKKIGEFFVKVFQKFDKTSIINSDKLRELTEPCWVCSTKKAERLLGFTTKTKLKEGMEWTAKWYKEKGWL